MEMNHTFYLPKTIIEEGFNDLRWLLFFHETLEGGGWSGEG